MPRAAGRVSRATCRGSWATGLDPGGRPIHLERERPWTAGEPTDNKHMPKKLKKLGSQQFHDAEKSRTKARKCTSNGTLLSALFLQLKIKKSWKRFFCNRKSKSKLGALFGAIESDQKKCTGNTQFETHTTSFKQLLNSNRNSI